MRIVCPLPVDYEVDALIALGIKEFYFGHIPLFWRRRYSLLNSINRRYTLQDQCQSRTALARLTKRDDLSMYLVLNAPLYTTTQIGRILKMIEDFARGGLKGLIIADLGLLFAVKARFPALALHVSSVAGCHNTAMVKFLCQAGARRVILPRTATISEIVALRRAEKGIEIEAMLKNDGCVNIDGLCTHHHASDRTVSICDQERGRIPRENVYAKLFHLFHAGVDCVKIVDRGTSSVHLLTAYRAVAWVVRELNARKPGSLREWGDILKRKAGGGKSHSIA